MRARGSRWSASNARDDCLGFQVEFSPLAAGKFRKLERGLRDRIVRKLEEVAKDPARHLVRLSAVQAYRLRIGTYRLIVDMDWEREIVHVLTLGHRSTVYD